MLYLSAIILAFFLSFILITKNNKTAADYILFAWLVTTGFHLVTFYLFSTEQSITYPTIVALGFPLPLAQGPFLYLYTCQQTTEENFKRKRLFHFVPVLLSYLLFSTFYFLSFEQKAEIFKNKGAGYELPMMLNVSAIYISGVVYIILSLRRLLNYRRNLVNEFSNTEKINFNWLLYLIIWMMMIWTIILFVQEDEFIFGAAALFIIWLGYFGIKQVKVFSHSRNEPHENDFPDEDNGPVIPDSPAPDLNNVKYQKSNLSETEAEKIHQRLKNYLLTEKPFTNPDLTLNELAKSLSVHPNHLSQVINSKENKNFYDLINEQRVNQFIQVVTEPVSRQFTLLAIAFDCGFNSKASFNRNFKKYTGITPSDFLKQHQLAD